MTTKSKKILIVDDEDSVIKLLSASLKEEGYKVLAARNGKEGFEMASSEQPDLILLDIVMPQMDGVTMLKKLKENKATSHISAMTLTNLSDQKTLMKCFDAGSHDYLIKSDWNIKDLLVKIKERIG